MITFHRNFNITESILVACNTGYAAMMFRIVLMFHVVRKLKYEYMTEHSINEILCLWKSLIVTSMGITNRRIW